MDLIYRTDYTITEDMCHRHVDLGFALKEDAKALKIVYSYSPKVYEGEDALEKAVEAFKEAYGAHPIDLEEVKGEMPLKNHVTLSLEKEEELVGTAHRHNNNIVVEVSDKVATVGFKPTKITKGEYKITLSVHAILCKVYAHVEVYAL